MAAMVTLPSVQEQNTEVKHCSKQKLWPKSRIPNWFLWQPLWQPDENSYISASDQDTALIFG